MSAFFRGGLNLCRFFIHPSLSMARQEAAQWSDVNWAQIPSWEIWDRNEGPGEPGGWGKGCFLPMILCRVALWRGGRCWHQLTEAQWARPSLFCPGWQHLTEVTYVARNVSKARRSGDHDEVTWRVNQLICLVPSTIRPTSPHVGQAIKNLEISLILHLPFSCVGLLHPLTGYMLAPPWEPGSKCDQSSVTRNNLLPRCRFFFFFFFFSISNFLSNIYGQTSLAKIQWRSLLLFHNSVSIWTNGTMRLEWHVFHGCSQDVDNSRKPWNQPEKCVSTSKWQWESKGLLFFFFF